MSARGVMVRESGDRGDGEEEGVARVRARMQKHVWYAGTAAKKVPGRFHIVNCASVAGVTVGMVGWPPCGEWRATRG